jgi:golgi-specific brefeldin A-resistance guanine nucleotide exchange factor 1
MSTLLNGITIDAKEPASDATETAVLKPKPRESSPTLNGAETTAVTYDPSMIFLLELATSIAIRNKESMQSLSSELAAYCIEVLRQRKVLHPILVERALIYLLALKKRGHEAGVETNVNLNEVIRIVLSTQPPLFQSLAVPLAHSLLALGQADARLILDDPRVLFQVLKKAILLPEAQASEFSLCELLVDTKDGAYITPKVYPMVINLLGDFATLGSVGAEWEQRNDVLQKRVKPSRTPDKP